ncbi:response regulator [Caballeronia zhejiangensis]|uniref:response regulator n=1 Tax=Caballeronia zhejiangensis TaxID=871203 RepID=UPI00158AB5B6|nr:response regulator [Caballeronia zhejiangensis]MCG7403030.1 response regulator [Caballeronia zhejiangensis]MCI1043854.1 response regulator [Caballeronia zhejiangensis]
MPSLARLSIRWTSRFRPVGNRVPRVLVVDDNCSAADALATFLGLLQFESHTAYSGAAAIMAARASKPDIVLLDISMPEIDGFAVAATLRRDPLTAGCIVVAFTAHDRDFVQARALTGQFDAYFQKGFGLDALIALLAEVVPRTKTVGNRPAPAM